MGGVDGRGGSDLRVTGEVAVGEFAADDVGVEGKGFESGGKDGDVIGDGRVVVYVGLDGNVSFKNVRENRL